MTDERFKTCHASPWALVRRCGDTPGKRPSTRMAYLVGTVAPDGQAIAATGFIMNNDLSGWTKSRRRIEWSDIVRQWHTKPTSQQVRAIKQRMPRLAEIECRGWRTNLENHDYDAISRQPRG